MIHLYDTLTRSKREFVPLDTARVGLYVCGPTVYDRAHIGNARPVVIFDVLYRLLAHEYGQAHVFYVRNLTDIDDKIIAAAHARGEEISAVTARTIDWFHDDMSALGAMPPTFEPRATAYVGEMIAMIDRLIATGHAYQADGHVLFSVKSWQSHGELSGRTPEDFTAVARVETAPYKHDQADFVLWKPSTADQPAWESPWSRGRPGWHIECSAMSNALLGPVFDIHGGGQDLIFPHHENEIAQSRCAHGTDTMARYWVHNGFVTINGQKMAKSTGNFLTVNQLLEQKISGEVIRYALLSAHYRQPLDIGKKTFSSAKASLDRLYGALPETDIETRDSAPSDTVINHLRNDLDTPQALASLHELANAIYRQEGAEKQRTQLELLKSAKFLGLLQAPRSAWFQRDASLSPTEIEDLIMRRAEAKAARDFALADKIRAQLAEHGIQIEDHKSGTTWRVISKQISR